MYSSNFVNPVLIPLMRLLGIEKRVQPAVIVPQDLLGIQQPGLDAVLAQLEQRLFRARQDVAGLLFAQQAAVHHVLRSEDDPAQHRLVLDDPYVGVEVGNLRQAVVERDQVAEPVASLELIELHQLVGYRDAVHPFPALLQFAHPAEDPAVLLQAEVIRLQGSGCLDVKPVVQKDGAEHEPLRIDVCGKAFFDRVLLLHGHE